MKRTIIAHKKEIMYKDFENGNEVYTITGIGKKAIKYQLNGQEDEFAFYDSHEGFIIGKAILKSFENESWNKNIIAKIEAQKFYARKNKAPNFAPEDGFCWSCHSQIYDRISLERAHSELITGCPHCHRSYCD